MSRTTFFKAGYIVALTGLGVIAFRLYQSGGFLWRAALIAALLIPGRIQGVLLRDLFRGRRLLDLEQPVESLRYTERFIALVRAQPWRNYLLWLSWSVYTPSAEAMALNNAGAAHLLLANIDSAHAAFNAALAIDPQYPLPVFNLAVLAAAAGRTAESEQLSAKARRLGYSGSAIDTVIQLGQRLLATLEGKKSG